MKKTFTPAAAAIALALQPLPALAHPHIFAEARLEVVADAGKITEIRNVWRFDDVFSSSVLLDFDKNTNLKLDPDELKEIADTIRTSTGDYDYFTFITDNGNPVKLATPDVFNVDFKDNQLLVFFIVKPQTTVPLKGKLSFGIYDPTFYTSIDFAKDGDLATEGPGFEGCKREVIRPDPDAVMAQNQNMMTEAFFNNPGGSDMGKLFATRLEVSC